MQYKTAGRLFEDKDMIPKLTLVGSVKKLNSWRENTQEENH
jgi:hypothetical protein